MFVQLPATTPELTTTHIITAPGQARSGQARPVGQTGQAGLAQKVYKRHAGPGAGQQGVVEGGVCILPGVPCVCRLRPSPMARCGREAVLAKGGWWASPQGKLTSVAAYATVQEKPSPPVQEKPQYSMCVCVLVRMSRDWGVVTFLFWMGVVGRWQHDRVGRICTWPQGSLPRGMPRHGFACASSLALRA